MTKLGNDIFYKAASDAFPITSAPTESQTLVGRAEMPFPPLHLNAVIDGSDIDLSWDWRSRLYAGSILPGSDNSPLGEAALEFEIDIMNGSTVKRTLTATTNSKTYLDADITTDFGSMPDDLTFRVYQISALVGRGYVAEKTISFGGAGSVGAASGVGAAAAVGQAGIAAVGAASGVGAATGVSAAASASVGASSGAASASATGASVADATAAASGTSTSAAVAGLPGDGAGDATGSSTAQAVGASAAAATASSAGFGAALAVGASAAASVGSAAGTSTASGASPVPDAVVSFANFQLPSATGNFTISTSTLGGKTPKMVVFCLSNAEVSEVGHGVTPEDAFHMFGAADGTNQWAAAASTESGSNNDRRTYNTTNCMIVTDGVGTTYLAATFVSFAANQVTINIGTLNAELYLKRGFAMFFAGADCQVEVGVIQGETDGAATKTLGFTPEGLLIGQTDRSAEGHVDRCSITFGFALNDGSATQYDVARDLGSGTGEARVNNKAAGLAVAPSPHTCTVSFSGADVTATWSAAIERDIPYAAWSFGGHLTAKAGTITTPTSPGQVTASGLGITPASALFLTGAGAVNTTVAGAGFGVGWLTAAGGGSMGCLSKTGYCSTTRLNISNGADFGEFEAFASGSLTVDFPTADATARLLPFIAFGT
ncbi:hypothetical protein AMC81_CH01903 [Rhizobium phaseoli]|uniref:Uncharacterized protein n=1 Tax=Rhizobium phaseoli TaxID=396 RepID=A0ABN4QLW8_9HYPH|nr:hypothetical protein AMC81_CH01903 [Rhizobium phaseoli]ANL91191.1 hypothetical protein AMC80_CH01903 [Rhizobium phaseoli]